MCNICNDQKTYHGVTEAGTITLMKCPVCNLQPPTSNLQPPTCMMCEVPTPATHLAGDWELCTKHFNAITDPGPTCSDCGQPLSAEDIAAGETRCLDCEGLALLAEIDMDGPLVAAVRVKLEAL